MLKLQNELTVSGVGSPAPTATKLKEKENIYLYQRSDSNVFEVFIAKTAKQGEVFGKEYPERELYPCNEDFGKTAWCYNSLEKAIKKFNSLT